MSHDPKIDEISGTETTGHEWDGIEELNTPMPRWWLGIFYITIIWAVIYAVLMPSFPFATSHFKGVLGYSDRAAVQSDIDAMHASRAEFAAKLEGANLEEIQANPELFRFAMASGRSAFGDNCATCHGSGAQGFDGFPNLNDDTWLWGGTFEDIKTTLQVGIRSNHDDTRLNWMFAYGRDGLLPEDQIEDLTEFVLSLSGQDHDSEAAERAKPIFQIQCNSCHGSIPGGQATLGAPDLTDSEWLYGGTREEIHDTIYLGREGVMPTWENRLSADTITALAVYVHSLGGGIDTPISQSGD